MVNQKKLFLKGIDSDTSDELLPDGVDRYRLNVRCLSSENGNKGTIETVNGNTLVSFIPPAGTNKVIGSKANLVTRKVYFFLYNSLNSHSIVEFDTVSNTAAYVLTHPSLNFKEDYLITSVNFTKLNDESTLMYWTDGYINPLNPNEYNEPKKINIEKGKLYMQGDYVNGYPSPFDGEFIFRIKKPPIFPLTYEWKGLDDYSPHFRASFQNDIVTFKNLLTSDIIFNQVGYNDGSYSDVSGKFTAPSTDNYEINVQFGVNVSIASNKRWVFDIAIFVNGVLQSSGQQSGLGSVSLKTIKFIKSVALNINDVVTIRVAYDTNDISPFAIIKNGNFSVTKVISVTNNINNLYKKLYQFKCKFVYDDYEESAWSPISNYVMPKTTGGGGSGNNIGNQDSIIIIDVPTGNGIVKKIKIAGKELNQGDWYELVELDKKELGIIDDSIHQYEFSNDALGLPLLEKESIKLFDNVPLVSQSSDIIKGERIVDGNITEGFNPVDIDMRLPLTYDIVDVNTNSFFPKRQYVKSGGLYQYGIVYYDHANRSGLTNIKNGKTTTLLNDGTYGTSLYIPFITEASYAPSNHNRMDYCPIVNAEIYNEPPAWATHYQIVRSKNKKAQRYFQFCFQIVEWLADGFATTTTPDSAVAIDINLSNITGIYLTENAESQLVYDWAKGDRIRFIAKSDYASPISNLTSPFYNYNDSEIVSADPATGKIRVLLNAANSEIRTFAAPLLTGGLVEIYSPRPTVDEEADIMYETGDCYDVVTLDNGRKAHIGLKQSQDYFTFYDNYYLPGNKVGFIGSGVSGFSVGDKIKVNQDAGAVNPEYNTYATVTKITPSGADEIVETDIDWQNSSPANGGVIIKGAVSELSGGDCFRIYQNISYIQWNVTTRIYTYIESQNASNMFRSNAADYGRPNRIDNDYKRITRPTTIYYSEKFIPETFINGLSSVYDDNFEFYNQNYGAIKRLHSDDDILIMFQEFKIGRVPVERIIYNDLQNNQSVGASSSVLSPQVDYYAGEYGLTHPESFTHYGMVKYGIDINRGVMWRLSNDGLTAISEIYSMHNYFTDKSNDILSSSKRVKIHFAYDVRFGEVIVCFEPYVSRIFGNVAGETLAFNERDNAFSTYYSFVPESICSIGIDIISCKNGLIYKHNSNSVQGNFYGVQYYPEIHSVCNINPSTVKVLSNVSEETSDAWEVYEIATQNGQKTSLISSDFEKVENNNYASLWRDENTPNVVDPLINGDEMRDRTFLLKFKYNKTIYTKLYSLNFGVIESKS